MLTDRMRVELALVPRLMHSVVVSGIEDPQHEDGREVVALLNRACLEPINDLQTKPKAKLIRRIERAYRETVEPFADRGNKAHGIVTAGKMGLIVFYLMQELIYQGILELYEGTPMAVAIERFMPFLKETWEIKEVDQSAQKQARRMLVHLQTQGYYVVPKE